MSSSHIMKIFIAVFIIALAMNEKNVAKADRFVRETHMNKTLVLVDDWAILETHSIFFDHIKKMGAGNHTLEFQLLSGKPSERVRIQ